MSKRLITVALLSTLTVGCAKGAMVGGAVMAGAGVLMATSVAASAPSCGADDVSCQLVDEPLNDMAMGLALIPLAVGAGMFLAGAVMQGQASDREAAAGQVVWREVPRFVTGAPGSALPAAYVVEAPAVEEPLVIGEAPVPVKRALPAEMALRARPETRLALQVSVVARAGQCEAAVLTGDRLAAIDPALYATLVVDDPAFASCLATRGAR